MTSRFDTEAQEVAADIPEDRPTHDQSEADSLKARPIKMGEILRKCLQATPGAQ